MGLEKVVWGAVKLEGSGTVEGIGQLV